MAKYTRFDPRNKKKNRHKNDYLDRSKGSAQTKRRTEDEEESYQEYQKYMKNF